MPEAIEPATVATGAHAAEHGEQSAMEQVQVQSPAQAEAVLHAVAQQNPPYLLDARHPDHLLQSEAVADNRDRVDWQTWFGLAQQTVNAANTAQSFGFTVAKSATAASLLVARAVTKGFLTLPALALDAVAGTPPAEFNREGDDAGQSGATVRSVTTSGVDGLFNVIDAVALGSLDLTAALTGASLSAASTGVDGIFSVLDSDTLRSLSTFGSLVR